MTETSKDTAPLTVSQQEFAEYEEQFPDTGINALFGLVEFAYACDDETLTKSIRCLTEHEQGLRLRIHKNGAGDYEQYDTPDEFEAPRVLRFSNEDALRQYLSAAVEEPLPWLDVPLCRFTILRSENRLWLLISAHHIAADGYMLSLTASRIEEGCEAMTQNRPLPFARHEVLLYARREMELLVSPRRVRDLAWWREQYQNWDGLCRLTPGRDWNGDPSGGRIERAAEPVLWDNVKTFCSRHEISCAVAFEAAWVLLLWRLNPGKSQVDICLNLHNRNTVEERETIGAFAVGRMLCVRPDTMDDYPGLCRKTLEAEISAARHFTVECCDLLPMLQELAPGTDRLYDLECSYLPPIGQGGKIRKFWLSNSIPETTAEFTLSCLNADELPHLILDYRTSLLSSAQAEELLDSMLGLLEQGIADSSRRIGELRL